MDYAEKIENLTGWMSGKPLGKELRLGFTRVGSTLNGLNETLARDGSDSAWLCGVRAITPRDKAHPASKPMTSAAPCAPVSMGFSLFTY